MALNYIFVNVCRKNLLSLRFDVSRRLFFEHPYVPITFDWSEYGSISWQPIKNQLGRLLNLISNTDLEYIFQKEMLSGAIILDLNG